MDRTIFSVWREYNSCSLKLFKSDTSPHLEALYLWRSRHRCFTGVFCSHTCQQSRAVLLLQSGSQQVPFARGWLSSSLPQHTEMFQKSSGKWWWIHSHQPTSFCPDLVVCWESSTEISAETFPSAPRLCCALCRQSGALTAGNCTSLQVTHFIYITICLMALKTAEPSGLTAVSPGFKFPCKTCRYLLLTSNLLF